MFWGWISCAFRPSGDQENKHIEVDPGIFNITNAPILNLQPVPWRLSSLGFGQTKTELYANFRALHETQLVLMQKQIFCTLTFLYCNRPLFTNRQTNKNQIR